MYGKRLKSILLGSTMAVVLPYSGAALAQQAQSSTTTAVELETVQVQTVPETGTGPVNGYVATQTTTGMKTDVPITAIPQSVSVIGRDELDDRKALKLDEALRYTPGVFSQPYGADNDTDWIYIRGFNATQTGVYLDSLNLYSYAFGGFIVDPFLLERVEVMRGPASVLYGGSNAGGLVNSVSKRADGERKYYVETGVTDDPNGYVAFDLGDKITQEGDWAYRLVGKVKGGDTQTDYADNFRGVIAPNLTWQPDKDTRLNLYATYQYDDSKHGIGFLPYFGSVKNTTFGKIDHDFFISEPDLDSFKAKQFSLGYEFERKLNDTVTLTSNTRYAQAHREEYGPYTYGYYDPTAAGYQGGFNTPQTPDNLLWRINFAHDTTAKTFTTDNRATFEFDTGPVANTLMTGVDYKYFQLDEVQSSGSANPLNPTDPVYLNDLPDLFDPYSDQAIDLNQVGLYAQEQAKFGDGFIVTLNGRYDFYSIDRDDRTAADADYDGDDGAFSGRAGLAYEFENGLVPYVSVAKFFNPQISTGSTSIIDPEQGEQYEVGLKYAPTFLDAVFSISLFDLTRENTQQTVYLAPTFTPSTVTVGEINSRGVELEANVNIDQNWKVKGAFTAYRLEITDDFNEAIIGNQPFLTPEVMGSLWVDYKVTEGSLEGMSLGGGLRYLGESYADNENQYKVPDVTLFDAAIRYDRDNWGVSANLNNVFDKEYVSGCQTTLSCGYGEGRSGLLKAHFNF